MESGIYRVMIVDIFVLWSNVIDMLCFGFKFDELVSGHLHRVISLLWIITAMDYYTYESLGICEVTSRRQYTIDIRPHGNQHSRFYSQYTITMSRQSGIFIN